MEKSDCRRIRLRERSGEHARRGRLNSDGSLDTTFLANLGTGPNSFVNDIAIQANGKILVAGSFNLVSAQSYSGVVRLNSDGSIDDSFRLNASFPQIYSIAARSDGKIYVGGSLTVSNRHRSLGIQQRG